VIKYKESVKFDARFYGILVLLTVIIISLDFYLYSIYPPDLVTLIADSTVIFLVFMLVNFRKLDIIITDRHLEFGFGIFKKRILINRIVSCKPFDVRFGQYFGIGIRYGLNNTILYNTRFGKAVRIKVKGSKRDYVVTSNNPKKLCNALRKG